MKKLVKESLNEISSDLRNGILDKMRDKGQEKRADKWEQHYAVMGGKNKINPPFNVGDIIKQKYTTDSENNLISGREEYEFVGMKGDLMLMKTLNSYAANSEDIFSAQAVKMNKKFGYKPEMRQTLQLHYMHADRFEVIK